MDKITHKVRCEQWTAIINECLASGMPKTTWCRANGISDKQFFYWQRILRQEAYQQMESQSSSPASSALVLNDKKEQASHPAFVEIRPDAMPEGGIYRFQTRCYYPFWKSGNGDLQYCFRGTDTKDPGTVSCLMMPLVLKRYF